MAINDRRDEVNQRIADNMLVAFPLQEGETGDAWARRVLGQDQHERQGISEELLAETDQRWAEILGVRPSVKVAVTKPRHGTMGFLGAEGSGIHPPFNETWQGYRPHHIVLDECIDGPWTEEADE